ncbi:MAG: CBS domain-containing protein [Cypionkella sp.]|nr:CBS domain-containing protein [Cypionkella sp.]
MLVSLILKQKPMGVITAAPSITVAELASLLADKKIGSVVLSTDGKTIDGIVSERDIVRAVAGSGAAALSGPVSGIMTRKVVTCTPDDRTDSVLQSMTDGRFRHLPVVSGGALVGLISIGDVVKARLSELSMEKDALEGMIKGF